MADWDWSIPGITSPSGSDSTPPSALTIPDIVKSAVDTMISGSKDILKAVGGVQGESAKATKMSIDAAQSAAVAKTQIENIDATAQAKGKQANAETAAALGTQPGAASELIAHYVQQAEPMRQEMYKTQNELLEMDKTGLFDDPIQFIKNAFFRPQVEKKEKDLEHFLNANATDVSNVQTISSAAMRDNAISTTADETTKIGARTQLNKAIADSQAAEALDKQISTNLAGINIRSAQNIDRMQAVFHEQAATIQVHEMQQADAMKDFNVSLRRMQEETRAFALKGKEDQDALIARGSAVMGLQGVTSAAFGMMDKNKQDAIIMAATNTVQGSVSISPSRSLDVYQKSGLYPAAPGLNRTLEKAESWLTPTLSTRAVELKAMGPDSRFAEFDGVINNHANQELGNIPIENGMYSFQPLNQALGIGALSQLPLIKEIAPLAKEPLHPTNPADFLSIGKNMIAPTDGSAPKATVEDVANQMAFFFRTQAADNNTVRNYRALNLPQMKVGNLPMTVPSAYGRGTQMLNVGDPSAVKNYLLKSTITDRQKRNKTFNARPGGFQ